MPTTHRFAGRWSVSAVAVAVAALSFASCAAGTPSEAGPAPTPTPSIQMIDDSFEVEDGRSLALVCEGEGEPTVIYDAGTGSGGIGALYQAVPSRPWRRRRGCAPTTARARA